MASRTAVASLRTRRSSVSFLHEGHVVTKRTLALFLSCSLMDRWIVYLFSSTSFITEGSFANAHHEL